MNSSSEFRDLLFLSAHLPVERSRQAGQKNAFRNLYWLAERYRVHLIAFRSEPDREEPLTALQQLCDQVMVVDVTRGMRFRGLAANPFAPLCVAARTHAGVRRTIHEWNRTLRLARVYFEWSQLAPYLHDLLQVPQRTLYIQDVLTQWAERRASCGRSWFWQFEAYRTRIWEKHAYDGFTQIYVPSAKDRDIVARSSPALRERMRVLPLYFDVYRSASPRRYDGPLRLLFWGALRRRENAEAARWLCANLVPRLRAIGKPFVVVLAGSEPPADIQAQRAADIEVTGFLADPAEQFGRAHLAVLPLFQGAGVKVKVLECLAAGLPVLTTEVGAEGIDASVQDGLLTVSPDADSFANQVSKFETDRTLLENLSTDALAWGARQITDHRDVLLR